jgi:putative addiction module component (TIGR02574 family)
MAAEPAEVLRAGMALSPADRESVALRLLDSLEEDVDQAAVDAAWAREIELRGAAAISGSVVGEPWEQVRAKVSDHLASKRS